MGRNVRVGRRGVEVRMWWRVGKSEGEGMEVRAWTDFMAVFPSLHYFTAHRPKIFIHDNTPINCRVRLATVPTWLHPFSLSCRHYGRHCPKCSSIPKLSKASKTAAVLLPSEGKVPSASTDSELLL